MRHVFPSAGPQAVAVLGLQAPHTRQRYALRIHNIRARTFKCHRRLRMDHAHAAERRAGGARGAPGDCTVSVSAAQHNRIQLQPVVSRM